MQIKRVLSWSIGICVILLLMFVATAAFLPLWKSVFAVEELVKQEKTENMTSVVREVPETVSLQAIYSIEGVEKKISAITLELLNARSKCVYYIDIPVNTKIELSSGLYKELQTYSPTVPQYFKLANMADFFSEEYAMSASNRILSEALGVTIAHWCRTDSQTEMQWEDIVRSNPKEDFFKEYSEWIAQSVSDRSEMERWMYYESYEGFRVEKKERVIGSEEVNEFTIWKTRAKERIEELMRKQSEAQGDEILE